MDKKDSSPDGRGNPFVPAFTSSVRFARVAQKIVSNSRYQLLKNHLLIGYFANKFDSH